MLIICYPDLTVFGKNPSSIGSIKNVQSIGISSFSKHPNDSLNFAKKQSGEVIQPTQSNIERISMTEFLV